MALPAPDYFAGGSDPTKGAAALFGFAGWIRRRCNEIIAEADLDVVKLYDLCHICSNYRAEAERWISAGEVTGVLEALVQLIREAGVGRPLLTVDQVKVEAKAVYDAAGVFLTWAQGNLLQAGQTIPPAQSPVVTVNNSPGGRADFSVRVTKQAAVATRVQTLRNALA